MTSPTHVRAVECAVLAPPARTPPVWTHDAALNAVLLREKARQAQIAEAARRVLREQRESSS